MSRTAEALGDIAERLRADPALADLVGEEIHIDYPGEIGPSSPVYNASNARPFLYFDALLKSPVGDCGTLSCRLRLYAESFAADRLEAHRIIDAAVAALDSRYGASPFAGGLDPVFVAGGDVVEPLAPRSAYADFTFSI